jgi:hypothetical protein
LFDTNGIIHWEFSREDQTISAVCYRNIMQRLWRNMNWPMLALSESKCWFLLHNCTIM